MQALRSAENNLESVFGQYSDACTLLAKLVGQNLGLNSLQSLRDELDEGLRILSAFESRVEQLKATLGETRNLISVPINFLPDEVLGRVFHFVMSAHSACFEQLVDNNELPKDILATSQVCSRWRQITLNLPTLWSYINLSSSQKTKYVSLGTIFSTRSGNLPLGICAVEQYGKMGTWDEARLATFFDEVGPRLESIELALVPSMSEFTLLKKSLARCTPGRLTRLIVSDRSIRVGEELPDEYFDSSKYWLISHYNSVPSALHNPHPRRRPQLIRIGTTQERLEDILLHITVLRLDRVYPAWRSKAYHGLAELRLIGPPQLTRIITEHAFAAILAASPKLRVLHFGLELTSTKGPGTPPIRLEELEEFQLQSLLHTTQQTVLRLISPGLKPLLMSTIYDGIDGLHPPPLVEDELCHFFKRSNIVQLQMRSDPLLVQLPNFLKLLPNLQTLIFRLVDLESLTLSPHEPLAVPLCPVLRDLHFISCGINLETLQWLASTHSLRKVVIWGSAIRGETGNRSIRGIWDFPVELHPIAQVLNGYEDTIKIEGWGEDLEERLAVASMKDYETF